MERIQYFILILVVFLYDGSQGVVQVQIVGFALPSAGAGALAYHAPALEAAVNECNRMYAGVLNLSLAFITGDPAKVTTNEEFTDLVPNWDSAQRRFGNSANFGPVLDQSGFRDRLSLDEKTTTQKEAKKVLVATLFTRPFCQGLFYQGDSIIIS
ncbi:hypothetical protein BV898_06964 [Hypsibius exemplaris]|uniref:Uncharacterized protein n=1 Tax=Hypsibius exemplaris TaxID=2072580 RepID=A0A1W0WUM4_HYPEX|nr:hypothetical protein BV898_06964 [Hypsibius exemplaris]